MSGKAYQKTWKIKNRDKYREYQREYQRNYRERAKEIQAQAIIDFIKENPLLSGEELVKEIKKNCLAVA